MSNVETANLVKYYKNESQFVVKVLNGDGTPANGTNVTFNINGVFYTRDVINGTATLNINLIQVTIQLQLCMVNIQLETILLYCRL